uniref:INO80 complex subunit F domain-containing protein n=1 Tax=Ditylenchus dipsaci TaxID=166011 RepID=A0A915E6N1_9BILA
MSTAMLRQRLLNAAKRKYNQNAENVMEVPSFNMRAPPPLEHIAYNELASQSTSFANLETPNGRCVSPTSKKYLEKFQHLSEYYDHISQSNNKLRHRIYHVKKEINHLKQLKKVLCERLLGHNAVILDSNLEIPDNDSGATVMDKVIGEVANTAHTAAPLTKRKRQIDNKKKEIKTRVSSDNQTKRNIRAIIDSVVNETHAASQGLRASQGNKSSSNLDNSFDCSESDQMSTDEMSSGRLLRESSIDHLLPSKPDYECQSVNPSPSKRPRLYQENSFQNLGESSMQESDDNSQISFENSPEILCPGFEHGLSGYSEEQQLTSKNEACEKEQPRKISNVDYPHVALFVVESNTK